MSRGEQQEDGLRGLKSSFFEHIKIIERLFFEFLD